MEEYSEVRHTNPDHARIVWINWHLGVPGMEDDPDLVMPTPEQLISFSDQLVSHYRDSLGKQLFIEFTGDDLTSTPGFLELIEHLNNSGARIGAYSTQLLDTEFWSVAKQHLDQLCLVVKSSDDQDVAKEVVNSVVDSLSLHVNYEVDPSNPNAGFRSAKKFTEQTTEITINVVVPRGTERDMSEDDLKRLSGATNMVRKLAAERRDRTRIRFAHRGTMTLVREDGEEEEMTPREIISKGVNKWNEWTCMAGIEQLIITVDGKIIRGWCHQGGTLGRITDDWIVFPTTGVKCLTEECSSTVDITCSRTWY